MHVYVYVCDVVLMWNENTLVHVWRLYTHDLRYKRGEIRVTLCGMELWANACICVYSIHTYNILLQAPHAYVHAHTCMYPYLAVLVHFPYIRCLTSSTYMYMYALWLRTLLCTHHMHVHKRIPVCTPVFAVFVHAYHACVHALTCMYSCLCDICSCCSAWLAWWVPGLTKSQIPVCVSAYLSVVCVCTIYTCMHMCVCVCVQGNK